MTFVVTERKRSKSMMCYEVTFTCQGQLMEKKVYKHLWMAMPWYIKHIFKVKKYGTMRVDMGCWRQ